MNHNHTPNTYSKNKKKKLFFCLSFYKYFFFFCIFIFAYSELTKHKSISHNLCNWKYWQFSSRILIIFFDSERRWHCAMICGQYDCIWINKISILAINLNFNVYTFFSYTSHRIEKWILLIIFIQSKVKKINQNKLRRGACFFFFFQSFR